MNERLESPWDTLWKRMEEDKRSYQALLEVMKEEWECLKKDNISSLIPLLGAQETHISTIKANQEAMIQALNQLMKAGVGEKKLQVLSDFLPYVSSSQAIRIKGYLKGVGRLRQQIQSVNEQNKRFIQETLNYLGSVFSLFTSSGQEEWVYAQKGKPIPTPVSACRMSREV